MVEPITPEQIKAVQQAMQVTWQAIRADVLSVVEPDYQITQMEVIGFVLDCDYLERYGRCDPEVLRKFRTLPYKEMVKIAKQTFTFKYYGYW